jgi:hypothetical protein
VTVYSQPSPLRWDNQPCINVIPTTSIQRKDTNVETPPCFVWNLNVDNLTLRDRYILKQAINVYQLYINVISTTITQRQDTNVETPLYIFLTKPWTLHISPLFRRDFNHHYTTSRYQRLNTVIFLTTPLIHVTYFTIIALFLSTTIVFNVY